MAAGFCHASIMGQGSSTCEVSKELNFHRVSNGFSLKSVVTVVTERNFTPRVTTTIIYIPFVPLICSCIIQYI